MPWTARAREIIKRGEMSVSPFMSSWMSIRESPLPFVHTITMPCAFVRIKTADLYVKNHMGCAYIAARPTFAVWCFLGTARIHGEAGGEAGKRHRPQRRDGRAPDGGLAGLARTTCHGHRQLMCPHGAWHVFERRHSGPAIPCDLSCGVLREPRPSREARLKRTRWPADAWSRVTGTGRRP